MDSVNCYSILICTPYKWNSLPICLGEIVYDTARCYMIRANKSHYRARGNGQIESDTSHRAVAAAGRRVTPAPWDAEVCTECRIIALLYRNNYHRNGFLQYVHVCFINLTRWPRRVCVCKVFASRVWRACARTPVLCSVIWFLIYLLDISCSHRAVLYFPWSALIWDRLSG